MEIQRRKFRMGIGEWIGVFGILLALLTWWHSTKTRDLLVRVSPAVVEVVKGGVASDLTVSYLGKPITSDLRAYQVAIWNAGREPIRREDVLKPLTLTWAASNKVVEIKIAKATRVEAEFAMNSVDYDGQKATFDWRILENADGGLVQLLVQGSERPVFSIAGTIVGQTRIDTQLKGPATVQQGESRSMVKWAWKIMIPIVFLAIGIFVLSDAKYFFELCKAKPRRWRSVFRATFRLFSMLVMLAFCGFLAWDTFLPESPFDF